MSSYVLSYRKDQSVIRWRKQVRPTSLLYLPSLQNEVVQKTFKYFDACANRKAIEAAGHRPILELIEDYGSWNATNHNWTESSWDFLATLVKMQKELDLSPLFKFEVLPDQEDSTRYTISVRKWSQCCAGSPKADSKLGIKFKYWIQWRRVDDWIRVGRTIDWLPNRMINWWWLDGWMDWLIG